MSAKPNRERTARPTQQAWRKSSHSDGTSACIEVAPTPDGGASIRDSKDPRGAILTFSSREWQAFLDGARDGEFSHMS